MKLIFLFLALLTTSCANYINKIHQDLDRGEVQQQAIKGEKDITFSQFRNRKYPGSLNSSNQKNLLPKTKRLYSKQPKRTTADDLTDNVNSGSLWSGNGNDNYLFTKNKWKRNGDIVLLKVMKDLKNEITMELKRAFPAMPIRPKNTAKGQEGEGAANQPPAQPTNDGQVNEEKVYDKISSVVIEEISKDHLLIRGQKFLLFRNRKHLVEVQALVARKDIMDDDTIDSTQLLESTVSVLR